MKAETGILVPEHLGEALSTLERDPGARPICGGTTLARRDLNFGEQKIIDLTAIPELKRISRTEKHIELGPALTMARILSIGRHVIPGILYDALKVTANPAVRNLATLGGNICQASPYSSPIPVLNILETSLELRSSAASRWVPVSKFVIGPGKTVLAPNEILTRIRIPLEEWNLEVFREVKSGNTAAYSTLTFSGLANISNRMVQDIRFAIGSVNSTVIRNRQLETPFIGHKLPLPERDTRRLEAEFAPILEPMDDSLATKNHRSKTTLRFVQWFLKELLLH